MRPSVSRLFCLLLATLPLAAPAQHGRVDIDGVLINLPGVRKVSLRSINGDYTLVPAVAVSEGRYSFRYSVYSPMLALLTFTGDAPIVRQNGVGDRVYNVPVFLQPGKIHVESRDSLAATSIAGSRAHEDYLRLRAAAALFENAIRRWREYAADSQRRADRNVQRFAARKVDSILTRYRDDVLGRFLQLHIGSPAAPWVLMQYWENEGDPEKVLGFLLNMPRAVRNRHPLAGMEDYARKLLRTRIGDEAPDFTLKDTLGQPVALSSFRGKWVLVDFWASWCLPCRVENFNLVNAFGQFKSRNFTILGVALEREKSDRKQWMAAIRSDSLTWTQVTDFKYFDSRVVKEYGVQAIPFNLLIDPQGRVVARYLRGERLWAKLDLYLE